MFSKGQANPQDGVEENEEYREKRTKKSVSELSERFKQQKDDNSDEDMENPNYITKVEKNSTNMDKTRSWRTEANESFKKKQKYAKRIDIDEEDQIGSKTSSSESEDDDQQFVYEDVSTKNDSKISARLVRLRTMKDLSKKSLTVSVKKGKYTYFSHVTYDE